MQTSNYNIIKKITKILYKFVNNIKNNDYIII